MSHEFNEKFERMLGNDPSIKDGVSGEENARYPTPGFSRYICFVLESGNQESFYYSNLIRCRYFIDDSEIHLEFTDAVVKLKGYKLAELHVDILNHQMRVIKISDSRYDSLSNSRAVVNSIELIKS